MSIEQLKQIIKNTTIARDHLATVPEERLDLRSYRRDTPCGTLFCAAGELTTLPYFATMGFKLEKMGEDRPGEIVWTMVDLEDGTSMAVLLDDTFGTDAFNLLFATYHGGRHDTELVYGKDMVGEYFGHRSKPISDKELIMRRFARYLNVLNEQLASRSPHMP